MRVTKRSLTRLATTALICAGTLAYGNINTNGEKGVVRTVSGKTMGQAKLNIGIGANYDQSPTYMNWIHHPDYPGDTGLQDLGERDPAKMLSTNVFLSLGLTSFWDLAVECPFYWDGSAGISDFGVGDIEISTKLLYPRPGKPRVFYQSYLLGVSGGVSKMSDKGIYPRHAYYYGNTTGGDIFTSDGFAVKAMLAWTFDIGAVAKKFPLSIDVNLGGVFPNVRKAITIVGNIALELSPVEVVTIFVDLASEIRGYTIINDFNGLRRDLIWLTPGIRINSPAGVYVMAAADIGLSDNTSTTLQTRFDRADGRSYSVAGVPRMGAQFSLGWTGFLSAQDDDRDGIKNDNDRCPKDAEDVDGFEDADGCPDLDNDKDGISDVKDKCPDKAEDIDNFEDIDGCPDVDNDGDGIPDIKDQCPNKAEDFDGIDDQDGCPDYDNDKDGIPDTLDKCPNDVEDFDKFKDEDGCPDLDNDKDGIPDLKDKCPNEPETFNNFQDEDGCPDELPKQAESTMPRQQTLFGVAFTGTTANLTPDSYRALDPIAEELRKFPAIEIEIRGHTDSMGKYQTNLNLSQTRAEAVRQYIISRGIDATRLRAVGFGSSSPIADNRTATGRTQNRRIEIVRIK
jgi:outer membrane protein OmpA-like peptidoglycan-associated protein